MNREERKRSLRLISFDPEELQAGDLPVRAHGDRIDDLVEIGSVFSLIFTWPQECRSYLQKQSASLRSIQGLNPSPVTGSLSGAIEINFIPPTILSEIDYLHFSIRDALPDFFLRTGDTVTFFVEIFQTSYRFESSIFEIKQNAKGRTTYAVLPPSELTVQKLRRLPRVLLPDSETVRGKIANQISRILEIGPDSFVAEISGEEAGFRFQKGEDYPFEFLGHFGKAQFLRFSKKDPVFQLKKSESASSEAFFKLYRSVRYPQFKDLPLQIHSFTPTTTVTTASAIAAPENFLVDWRSDLADSTQLLLLQIESLLMRGTPISLYVTFPINDPVSSRLWTKFCQESKHHKSEYPKSTEDSSFPTTHFSCAGKVQGQGHSFVKLNEKDLLHLYSSVHHIGTVLMELQKRRKTG